MGISLETFNAKDLVRAGKVYDGQQKKSMVIGTRTEAGERDERTMRQYVRAPGSKERAAEQGTPRPHVGWCQKADR